MARDYTGFASKEFALYFNSRLSLSLDEVAKKLEMDPRDLKRVVQTPRHEWVGLHMADRIGMTIGLDVAEAVHQDELRIIPGHRMCDAIRMAEDEFWLQGVTPTTEQLKTRANDLIELRSSVLKEVRELVIEIEDPVCVDSLSDELTIWIDEEELCVL